MGETVKTEGMELIVRSLVHYSCRLKELQDHTDIKKGNSILKLDLDQNAKNAIAIKNSMPSNFDDVIGTKEGKMICLALLCYVSDLKSSIGKSNELMGNINMEFQNVQNEIDAANKIRSKIDCTEIKFPDELEKDPSCKYKNFQGLLHKRLL